MLGAEFPKVLRGLLGGQKERERDGFSEYCWDLPVLIALWRKAGKALWKHISTLVVCFFANGPFEGPFYEGHVFRGHRESSRTHSAEPVFQVT